MKLQKEFGVIVRILRENQLFERLQARFQNRPSGSLLGLMFSLLILSASYTVGNSAAILLQVVAVLFASWGGGLYPGLLVTLVGALTDVHFFLKPYGNFRVDQSEDLLPVSLFVLAGVAIAVVNERRRRVLERLQASEKRYELVAESASGAVWDWDLVTNEILWNNGVHHQFQYPKSLQVTPADWWGDKIHPEDRQRVFESLDFKSKNGEEFWYSEYRFMKADKTYAFVIDRGRIIRDHTGTPIRMVGSITDLSERRRIEQALAEQSRLSGLRADVGIFLTNTTPLEPLLQQCTEAITARLQASSSRIWLTRPGADQLELVAVGDAEDLASGIQQLLTPEGFPISQIAETRLQFHQDAVHGLHKGFSIPDEYAHQVQDFAGFPLMVEENTVGVLAIFFPEKISSATQQDLASLSDSIAQLIQRRRDAEKFHEQQQQYRSIFEASNDGLIIFDSNGLIVEANPTACELHGYRYEELIGKSGTEIIDAQDSSRFEKFYERIASGLPFFIQSVHLKKDGTRVHVEIQGSSMQFRGTPHLLTVVRDVSERQEAEQQFLKLSQESERQRRLYDTILSNSLDQMCVFDLGHRFVYANQAMLTAWGKTWEQIVGKNGRELGYPDWQARKHSQELDRVIETKQPVRGEIAFAAATGRRTYDYIFYPVLGIDGEVEAVAGTLRDVTDRKQTENNLRQSEGRFRQLADAMPQIVWTATPNGYIDYYNNRWYEYTGFSADQRGTACWEQILHPSDVAGWKQLWQNSVENGGSFETEFRLFDRKTNRYQWFLGRAACALDEYGDVVRWFGTCTGITRQKRNEQISDFLASTSSRLVGHFAGKSTMVDIALSAVPHFADWCVIDMWDDEGENVRVAAVHASPTPDNFEAEIEQIYPSVLHQNQLLSDTHHTESAQLISSLWAGHPVFHLLEIDRGELQTLQERWLQSCICVPLVSRGKMLGTITYAMANSGRNFDINDLRAAEDVALRFTVSLDNTNLYRQLQETDQRKDEFLAMLAHELRNPLAPIRSGLDLMLLEAVEENRAMLLVMKDQVEHLVRLVDDLLDASRIMRGKIGLQQEVVDFRDILARSIASSRWNFRDKQQTFHTEVSAEAMPVYGDPVRLVQVVSNLLNNASKYTDPKGTITLKAAPDGQGKVILRVIDNGMGIEADLLPQVFDLFTQSSRALDRSQGGLGIGLTLVRNLVDMHQGAVSVLSDGPGTGSEFCVELPLTEVADNTQGGGNSLAAADHGPLKILVVDDNIGAAQLLTLLLAKIGPHKIEMAHDGFAALEKLKTSVPDLILLDIGLPEMDGYEVARKIRSQPEWNHVLLVALTGYGRDEDRKQSKSVGFDEHLVKPPALDILRSVLRHPRLAERKRIE